MSDNLGFNALDKSKIGAAIGAINKSGKALSAKVHLVACSILVHAADCGDHDKLNKLYHALPGSIRKADFVRWVLAHSPLNFDKKSGRFIKAKKTDREYDPAGAYAVPFWEYSADKDTPEKPFDDIAAIKALLKRRDKAVEEGRKVNKTDDTDKAINALRALVGA